MKLLKSVLILLGVLIVIMVALNGINILQAGSKKPDGRIMAEILGVDPETATYDDVEKLSRRTKCSFYAAHTPDVSEINGEYDARLLSGGILGPSSALFTHHMFSTGRVTPKHPLDCKGFKADSNGTGQGYNIFSQTNSDSGFHPAHPAHADVSRALKSRQRREAFVYRGLQCGQHRHHPLHAR
ncbi:MAG: hypothetical protein R2860_09670 [Desulfobacterales bacterium]